MYYYGGGYGGAPMASGYGVSGEHSIHTEVQSTQ